MLWIKKNICAKMFFAFCIFFASQVSANTLPFNWTDLNSVNPPSPREFSSQAFDPCSGQIVLFGGSNNGISLGDTWVFDYASNTWTELTPPTSPSAREAAVMIFDQSTGYLILFGGTNSGGSLGDTWSFDVTSSTWTELTPSSSPPARYAAAMDFDASSGQLILFGGYNGSTYFNDTWAFDPTDNTWINLTPANPPSVRLGAAMSFNPCNGQNFLFGGKGPDGLLNDSWVFNANDNTNTWTQLNPSVSPEPRYSASMDFDQTNGLMMLFGGKGNNGLLNDTWGFDAKDNANTWMQMTLPTSPPARYGTRMKFDPSSGQMILFGGSGNNGNLNDTWAFGLPSNAVLFWDNLNPSSSPSARFSASFAFDQTSGQMILFGGITHSGGTYLNDTWAYDVTQNIWTELFPTTSPSPRNSARMDYDPSSGKTILFGGHGPGVYLNDTWSFDFSTNTWTNMSPIPSPPSRNAPAMGYDQSSGRLILFSGYGGSSDYNDTWAYDARANTWTQLTTIGSPPARDSASVAFDSSSGQLILFGGYSNNTGGNLLNDTWALTYNHIDNTYTWTELFPPTQPSGRYGFAMKFDPASGQVILFGGGHLSGTYNDTWSYDGKANTWTELNPINPPAAREFPAWVFNPKSGQMILFGGVALPSQTVFDDTQALGFGVAPQITSANEAAFEVGVFSSYTVTTIGFPNPTITEVGALPSGITFVDNGDGTATLSGTPAGGTAGTYSLSFTATNSLGSINQLFTLTVDQAPVITSADETTFTVGTAGTFIVTATGYPSITSYTITAGTLPRGVTFNSTTGLLSGTPAADTGGSYPITITASNGIFPAGTQAFTLIIDQVPEITSPDSATFAVGTSNTFTVSTTGYPTPSITESGALPSGVNFVDNGNGTGTLSGTPAAGTTGTYNITFTLSNGVGSPITQTFTLLIQPVFPPSNFIGVIKTNKFLNKTEYVLTANWDPSPSPDIIFYQIYKNGVLVDTISAGSPLVFKTCVKSKYKINYQIVAINSANIASLPVSITVIKE